MKYIMQNSHKNQNNIFIYCFEVHTNIHILFEIQCDFNRNSKWDARVRNNVF